MTRSNVRTFQRATVNGDSHARRDHFLRLRGPGSVIRGATTGYAAPDNGLHVTWIPSYGPEIRGGTAHCTVVVSDEPIGSPLVRRPANAITLNLPSFEKYEPLIEPGGLLVYNSSLIDRQPTRTDIRTVPGPANDIAEQLGNVRQANVVLLSAYLAASGVLPLEAVATTLDNHLPSRQRRFLESNKEALRTGTACAVEAQTVNI